VIGRTIHHYEIISKIGEGGMGVVYKAHDQKLDRHVALKFLPREMSADPDVRRRFMHEARAASALDHPNISTVHEINETPDGRLFIVMPCYDGETVRERLEQGPFELSEALKIAVEIANGLARAHERGVIHRDVKPGNIMLCTDGQAKIMDFGLAKIAGASRVTQTGMTVGTVAYMSPEQTQGRDIDHRCDVWALGAVLYEMITGKPPFHSEHQAAIVYSILNSDPEPLSSVQTSVPFEVEQLVSKAMEKDPDKRFQTAREMTDELELLREKLDLLPRRSELKKRIIRQRRRLALTAISAVVGLALAVTAVWYFWPGRAEAIDSIAVIPLENLSGDEAQDIWADGITAELISSFQKVGGFKKVTPRSAVMRYKGTQKLPREIAEELDVKVVLQGTFLKVDTRVKITLELIDGESEAMIWANSFIRRARNILALQSEIALAVVDTIGLELMPEDTELLTVEQSIKPDAYEAYLWGRSYEEGWTSERRAKALESFHRAIEIDSSFADAYAWLAFCYATGEIGGVKDLDSAWALSQKALELAPNSAIAHEALGWILLNRDYDWNGAAREMEEAQRLAPGSEGIQLPLFYNLMGNNEKAIELAERRVQSDPLDHNRHLSLGFTYMVAGRPDDAIERYQRILERFEGEEESVKDAWEWIAYAYAQKGLPDSSFAIAHREGLDTSHFHLWDWVYAVAGMPDSAMRHLEEFKSRGASAALIGGIYGLGGYRDEAFEWLNLAYEDRATWLLFLNTMSAFGCADSLITDPRWDDLTDRIGFPNGNWERRKADLE
jgi:serine/threonine protein kinase